MAGTNKRQNKREDNIGYEVKLKNNTDGSQEHSSKLIVISLFTMYRSSSNSNP